MSIGVASRSSASAQVDSWQSSTRVHVLLEDLDLYEALPPRLRDRAVEECVADTVELVPGSWPSADLYPRLARSSLGLLVLDGLLLCRRGIEGRFGAELLGSGDLLRPSQESEHAVMLPLSTSRRVLAPTRVAVLDLAFAAGAGRYPQLSEELLARAINRSRNLAALMAIVHQPRVDARLHALFWHLAGRWGLVTTDGVLVPLRLTHSVLADLVAARRPTVSSALAELSRRELLQATESGWHLSGEPPCELCEPAGEKPLPATIAA